MKSLCEKQGKVIFKTKKKADKRAAQINTQSKKLQIDRPDLKSYRCEVCDKWHLTKKKELNNENKG